jgi:hypothetical protein
MALRTRQLFCETCQQPRPFDKPGPNHVLHLLLSCITFGLWLIMWFFAAIADSPKEYHCRTCGWQPSLLRPYGRRFGGNVLMPVMVLAGALFFVWLVYLNMAPELGPVFNSAQSAAGKTSTELPRAVALPPNEESSSASLRPEARSTSSNRLANLSKAIEQCESSIMDYSGHPEARAGHVIDRQAVAYAVDQELRERSWTAGYIKARILQNPEQSGLIWYRDAALGCGDLRVCTEPFPGTAGTSTKHEYVTLQGVPDGPFLLFVQVEWPNSSDATVYARLSDRRKVELKKALEAAARSALEDLPFTEILLCEVWLWNTETQRFD